jgi:hypothetical protein
MKQLFELQAGEHIGCDVKLVTSDNEALILKEPENKFYLKLKCSSNKFSN